MTNDEKILDLSRFPDERVEELKAGIKHWEDSGDGMHMITNRQYDANMATSNYNGMVSGLFAAGLGVLIPAGIFWALPRVMAFGQKLFSKLKN